MNDTWSYLDNMTRAELPNWTGELAFVLDDWLFRMHGISSGGHHVGVFLNLAEQAGLTVNGRQTIWREDDRIRRSDGTGYSDRVSDEQIIDHIADDDGPDPTFKLFARAVLALRYYERAAAVPVSSEQGDNQ